MAYAPPKECVRGLCPRGSVFTRGPMERGDSAVQVDRVGCATAAREGRCGGRTDESRFCSASSSTTGRVVSPLMSLMTPGTQHHSTPSSLRTISRKNPARAGTPPRARRARKPDPWARAHCAGSANHKGFSHRGQCRGVPRNRRSVAHYHQGGTASHEWLWGTRHYSATVSVRREPPGP